MISLTHFSLDLNLSLHGEVVENVVVQQQLPLEYFSAKDFVMLTPAKAFWYACNMLSSSDQKLLARRYDFVALDESMCLSIQVAAWTSNLCHRLRAKMQENEDLYADVVLLKKQLHESEKTVG